MTVSRDTERPVAQLFTLDDCRDWRGFLRCFQCGREGTQQFKIIQQAVHEPTGQVLGPFVVCAADRACRSRWPKPTYMGSE